VAKHAVMPQLKMIQKALKANPVIPFISFEHAVSKLHEAGELSKQELTLVLDYNEKRKLAVRVDEYTFDLELLDTELNVANAEQTPQADAA
jgi:hypothetical protein